jgi:hypothetical protein
MEVERGRLRFFCRAIGETRALYHDAGVARAAGYRDIPAPPTFLLSTELDSGSTEWLLNAWSVPFSQLLHGEQSFSYHHPVCAGDTLRVESVVSDIYDRKGGALEFVVKDSTVNNQEDVLVAGFRTVFVIRHV